MKYRNGPATVHLQEFACTACGVLTALIRCMNRESINSHTKLSHFLRKILSIIQFNFLRHILLTKDAVYAEGLKYYHIINRTGEKCKQKAFRKLNELTK